MWILYDSRSLEIFGYAHTKSKIIEAFNREYRNIKQDRRKVLDLLDYMEMSKWHGDVSSLDKWKMHMILSR